MRDGITLDCSRIDGRWQTRELCRLTAAKDVDLSQAAVLKDLLAD